MALVLLDREGQVDCPGAIAAKVEAAIDRLCSVLPVRVVLKNHAFENWLVADLNGVSSFPARFRVTPAIRRRVEPDKADDCNGYALLNRMVVGGEYRKVADSDLILRTMNVLRAGAHSRSFRHFLHAVEVSSYREQCRVVVAPPRQNRRAKRLKR